ncbi:MAG: NAD-dependent epimerase/dehydratase family protein [Candidatus Tyrphobacter sp.]
MRIAITGGAGFIGARTTARLRAAGHETVTIGRHGSEDVVVDLLDERLAREAILRARAGALVHLAWSVKETSYKADPRNERWLEASLAILRAFLEGGGDSIAVAGTCLEYGAGSKKPLAESDATNPETAYARAKHALHARAAHEIGSDARLAWARVFFPYGRGEPRRKLFTHLIDEIAGGRVPALTHPDRILDFVAADDVAEALCRTALRGVSGTVNVGTGTGTTARAIARTIALRLRPELAERIDALPRAQGEHLPLIADTKLMFERLGRWPLVTLDDGIAAMLGK